MYKLFKNHSRFLEVFPELSQPGLLKLSKSENNSNRLLLMFPFPPQSMSILEWEDFLEKKTIALKSLGFQERKQNVIKAEKFIPKHRKIRTY